MLTLTSNLVAFAEQAKVHRAEVAGLCDAEYAHCLLLADGTAACDRLFPTAMATVFQWRNELHHVLSPDVQQRLARWNRERLQPRLPDDDWHGVLESDREMLLLEGEFIEHLRSEARARAVTAPVEPAAFVAWYESRRRMGQARVTRFSRGSPKYHLSSKCAGTWSRKRLARQGSTT